MNEIEEFYSYIEMPQVAENLKAWEGSFKTGVLRNPTITEEAQGHTRVDEKPTRSTESARRTIARKFRTSRC
jgi:hypothetical protein